MGKDARNTQQGYDYTSAESIIAAARKWLLEEDILVGHCNWTLGAEIERSVVNRTDGRDPATYVTRLATYDACIEHVPSGESRIEEVQTVVVVSPGRPWDKANLGAQTSSWSYWLRDLLLIPRFNDAEDISGRDDSGYDPKRKTKKAPPAAAAAAPRQAFQPEKAKGGQPTAVPEWHHIMPYQAVEALRGKKPHPQAVIIQPEPKVYIWALAKKFVDENPGWMAAWNPAFDKPVGMTLAAPEPPAPEDDSNPPPW